MKSKTIVLLVVVALALGALGAFGYRLYLDPAVDTAVDLVPADAVFYANLFVDPSTHQKQALQALLRHFPGLGGVDETGNAVGRLVDGSLLSGTGLTFKRDVEPWLGREVAVFADNVSQTNLDLGFLIGTRDTSASQRFLDALDRAHGGVVTRRVYKEVHYEVRPDGSAAAVLGGFLVIGNGEDPIRAAIAASRGNSLAGSDSYHTSLASLPSDLIGSLYFNAHAVAAELTRSQPILSIVPSFIPPIAAALYARPTGAVIESAIHISGSSEVSSTRPVLSRVPRSAWAAVAVTTFGADLRALIDQIPSSRRGPNPALGNSALDASDVLDWLGAAAVFVAGKGTPTFGAITKPDGQKADFAVGNAGRFAIANGVHLSFFRPSAFGVAGLGRRLVVRSYGDVEAGVLGKLLVVPLPGDGITGTPLFQSAESALGTGFSVNGFLDVQRFIDYLHDSGSIRSVASNLDPLSYVVAGSKAEGGTLTVRVVMGVK